MKKALCQEEMVEAYGGYMGGRLGDARAWYFRELTSGQSQRLGQGTRQ
jgi:hypothetical protein